MAQLEAQSRQLIDQSFQARMADNPDGGYVMPVDIRANRLLDVPELVDRVARPSANPSERYWGPTLMARALEARGVQFQPNDWAVLAAGDAAPDSLSRAVGTTASPSKFGANTPENAAASKLIRQRVNEAGYDGVRYKAREGSGSVVDDADSYLMTRPGTVYSATTGAQLFANNATGASVPLALNALERAGGQKLAPDLWHGTNNIFEQFDLAQAGSAGQGSFMGKNGVYLSPDPLGASGYGRYLMRVEPQFQNPHIMPTTNMDLQLSDDYTRSLLDAGHDAVIMRLMDRDRETGEVLSAYDQEVFAMRPEQLVIKEIIDQDAKNVDLYDIPRSLFGWLGGPYYK